MAIGRPSEYTDEIQRKADEYVDGGFEEVGDVVPSRAGLSIVLGCSRNTLTNWEKFPPFLSTLDRLNSYQERLSLNGGLRGDMNSTIVKLLLANHGYSDKQDLSHTSPDGSMTPKPLDASSLSDAALQELMDARAASDER